MGKGECFFALKQFQDAEQAFQKALEILPEDPHAWERDIDALSILGKYGEVLLNFKKYSRIVDSEVTAWACYLLFFKMGPRRHRACTMPLTRQLLPLFCS